MVSSRLSRRLDGANRPGDQPTVEASCTFAEDGAHAPVAGSVIVAPAPLVLAPVPVSIAVVAAATTPATIVVVAVVMPAP